MVAKCFRSYHDELLVYVLGLGPARRTDPLPAETSIRELSAPLAASPHSTLPRMYVLAELAPTTH
jgi:hypothetical protein